MLDMCIKISRGFARINEDLFHMLLVLLQQHFQNVAILSKYFLLTMGGNVAYGYVGFVTHVASFATMACSKCSNFLLVSRTITVYHILGPTVGSTERIPNTFMKSFPGSQAENISTCF
jgi:hypothetical protein